MGQFSPQSIANMVKNSFDHAKIPASTPGKANFTIFLGRDINVQAPAIVDSLAILSCPQEGVVVGQIQLAACAKPDRVSGQFMQFQSNDKDRNTWRPYESWMQLDAAMLASIPFTGILLR